VGSIRVAGHRPNVTQTPGLGTNCLRLRMGMEPRGYRCIPDLESAIDNSLIAEMRDNVK
jgi:hypothetical protein